MLAAIALLLVMSTGRAKVQCRVCVEFRGRANCATAAGPTERAARDAAQTTACGPVANGMDEQIGCGRAEATVVECKSR